MGSRNLESTTISVYLDEQFLTLKLICLRVAEVVFIVSQAEQKTAVNFMQGEKELKFLPKCFGLIFIVISILCCS